MVMKLVMFQLRNQLKISYEIDIRNRNWSWSWIEVNLTSSCRFFEITSFEVATSRSVYNLNSFDLSSFKCLKNKWVSVPHDVTTILLLSVYNIKESITWVSVSFKFFDSWHLLATERYLFLSNSASRDFIWAAVKAVRGLFFLSSSDFSSEWAESVQCNVLFKSIILCVESCK